MNSKKQLERIEPKKGMASCEEPGLQDSKVALRYGDGTALLDSLPEAIQTQHIAGETLDIV